MNDEQKKKYAEFCKNEAIQRHKPEFCFPSKRYCFGSPDHQCWDTDCSNCYKYKDNSDYECLHLRDWVWIPHLGELIEMLGKRFRKLAYDNESDDKWVIAYQGIQRGIECECYWRGSSPEIACVQAIIQLKKEIK